MVAVQNTFHSPLSLPSSSGYPRPLVPAKADSLAADAQTDSKSDVFVGSLSSLPSIPPACAKQPSFRSRPQPLATFFVGLLQVLTWPFTQLNQALLWFGSHPRKNDVSLPEKQEASLQAAAKNARLAASKKPQVISETHAMQMELNSIRLDLAKVKDERDTLLSRLRQSEPAGQLQLARLEFKENLVEILNKIRNSTLQGISWAPSDPYASSLTLASVLISVERDLLALHHSIL